MATLFDDSDDTAAPGGKITPDDLLEIWNTTARVIEGLRGARALNQTRRRRISKLLSEFPSRQHWQDVVAKIAASGFCTGRIAGHDGRVFHADFDFLTRHETHLKVLEGKYDDTESGTGGRRNGRARMYREADEIAPIKTISGDH